MTHDFRFTYFLLMLAALGTCSLLLRKTQEKLPLLWWQKLGIGVGAFCGAMIGAKLPFLFLDWNRFLDGSAWLSDGKRLMFPYLPTGGEFTQTYSVDPEGVDQPVRYPRQPEDRHTSGLCWSRDGKTFVVMCRR